ncbi:MAG: hypothetical protein AAGI54_02495 [Planctomycetota bacterium]
MTDTPISLFGYLAPPIMSRRRSVEVRDVIDRCFDVLSDNEGRHGLPDAPDEWLPLADALEFLKALPLKPADDWRALIEHGDPNRAPSSSHKLRSYHA